MLKAAPVDIVVRSVALRHEGYLTEMAGVLSNQVGMAPPGPPRLSRNYFMGSLNITAVST